MIFLDFEGFMDKNPSLVGYQIEGQFKQIILDKNFLQISNETETEFQEFEEFCEWIILKSNELDEPITAWSSNEFNVFKDFQEDINYCNLLQEAKKKIKQNKTFSKAHKAMPQYWVGQKKNKSGKVRQSNNPFLKKRWDLITVLKLLNYPGLNTGYGKGKVTARLSAIQGGLNARGSYKKLTPVQKGKWTKLLRHNFIDVDGMVYIADKLDISSK